MQIHNIIVSSDDTIVPNTGEENMEVSSNIDDEPEANLPEMYKFFLSPPTYNESNMFTSDNDGI